MAAKQAAPPGRPVSKAEVRRFLKDGWDAMNDRIRGSCDPDEFDAEDEKLNQRYRRVLWYVAELERRVAAAEHRKGTAT